MRAWRSLDRFEDRGSIRPWLYRIATNRCLTMLAHRRRRELPTDLDSTITSTVEHAWLEPYPDQRLGWAAELSPEAQVMAQESVELAFVAALQHLPARQRAVLLLREVLGFTAGEVAEQLGATVASVNSALQRARKAVADRLPEHTQHATFRSLGEDAVRKLARQYAAAWQAGDVDAIVTMLAEDVTYSMPPLAAWYQGRPRVRAFLREAPLRWRWRFLPTRVNGQLAFGTYRWDGERVGYVPSGLDVLRLRGVRIVEVVSFLTADFLVHGLPERLVD